jgi:hypothetical protein
MVAVAGSGVGLAFRRSLASDPRQHLPPPLAHSPGQFSDSTPSAQRSTRAIDIPSRTHFHRPRSESTAGVRPPHPAAPLELPSDPATPTCPPEQGALAKERGPVPGRSRSADARTRASWWLAEPRQTRSTSSRTTSSSTTSTARSGRCEVYVTSSRGADHPHAGSQELLCSYNRACSMVLLFAKKPALLDLTLELVRCVRMRKADPPSLLLRAGDDRHLLGRRAAKHPAG